MILSITNYNNYIANVMLLQEEKSEKSEAGLKTTCPRTPTGVWGRRSFLQDALTVPPSPVSSHSVAGFCGRCCCSRLSTGSPAARLSAP